MERVPGSPILTQAHPPSPQSSHQCSVCLLPRALWAPRAKWLLGHSTAWSIVADRSITELGGWHEPMPHGSTVTPTAAGEPGPRWAERGAQPLPFPAPPASVSPSVNAA